MKIRIRPEGNAFSGIPRSKTFETDRSGEVKVSLPRTTGKFFIDVKECTSGFNYVNAASVTINQVMLNNQNYPYRFRTTIRETVCRLPINRPHNNSPSVSPRESLPEFKGSGTLTLAQFIEYYADDVLNRVVTRYIGQDSSPRTEAAAIGRRVINYPLKNLEASDFVEAGRILSIEVNAIRAFYEVEAASGGFLPCGIPKILYERHWVWKKSNGTENELNRPPKLDTELSKGTGARGRARGIQYIRRGSRSATEWAAVSQRDRYADGLGAWARFAKAIEKGYSLDDIAYSVSWGGFQVMGFHFRACGFPNATAMANAAFKDEKGHLKMFIGFAQATPALCTALRNRNWVAAATVYNGTGDAQRYGRDIQNVYTRLNQRR